jgi:hypothetical protein
MLQVRRDECFSPPSPLSHVSSLPLRPSLPQLHAHDAQETKAVFEKLHKYIGKNIRRLVEAPSRTDDDGAAAASTSSANSEESAFVFRLHRNRVYYVRASLMRRATSVSRDKLVHLGTAVGRLTHSGKFRLTVGALDLLAQHAKYKVGGSFLFPLSLSLSFMHSCSRARCCVFVCVCAADPCCTSTRENDQRSSICRSRILFFST